VREVVWWPAAAAQPAPLPASGRADPRADMPTLPTAFFSTLVIKINHSYTGLGSLPTEKKDYEKERTKAVALFSLGNRINMELDLQSLFGLLCTEQLYSLVETPSPAFGLIHEGDILVSQDRRHLFVTPWVTVIIA
jgi:hypothetical protein